MKSNRGEKACEKKKGFGSDGVGEGHGLFFRIVNQIELDNSDLTGAVHQLYKKPIVHLLIAAEVNFSIRLTLGKCAEFFIKEGQRDWAALKRDGPLGIDRDHDGLWGGVSLSLGGGEFDLKGG